MLGGPRDVLRYPLCTCSSRAFYSATTVEPMRPVFKAGWCVYAALRETSRECVQVLDGLGSGVDRCEIVAIYVTVAIIICTRLSIWLYVNI